MEAAKVAAVEVLSTAANSETDAPPPTPSEVGGRGAFPLRPYVSASFLLYIGNGCTEVMSLWPFPLHPLRRQKKMLRSVCGLSGEQQYTVLHRYWKAYPLYVQRHASTNCEK